MQIRGTEFTPFILSLAKLISIKILHSIHDSIASICAYCYDVPGSWMLSPQIYSNFTVSFTFMRNQVLEHAIFSPQEHAKNVLIFERWKSKRNLREKDAENREDSAAKWEIREKVYQKDFRKVNDELVYFLVFVRSFSRFWFSLSLSLSLIFRSLMRELCCK